jgi:TolB-like protein
MRPDALRRLPEALEAVPRDLARVAVYAIEPDPGGRVNAVAVQDRIVAVLLRAGRFQVVDRKMLKALLEEQALSLTGVVDEAAMVKAGRLIGVQGFFYGAVDGRADRLVLTLKLVAVETGAIVWAREVEGEAASRSRIGLGCDVGARLAGPPRGGHPAREPRRVPAGRRGDGGRDTAPRAAGRGALVAAGGAGKPMGAARRRSRCRVGDGGRADRRGPAGGDLGVERRDEPVGRIHRVRRAADLGAATAHGVAPVGARLVVGLAGALRGSGA